MRAQANFIENAPLFLIIVAGLELSGANRLGLGVIAGDFLLAQSFHGSEWTALICSDGACSG